MRSEKNKLTEMIISHIREKDFAIQTNEEHSLGVAKLCEKFASDFGFGQIGRIMGLLHDKGKEQEAFQLYIKKSSGYDENAIVPAEHNHAYVGGLIAKKMLPFFSHLIDNPLMGHHRGLYDYVELLKEEQKNIPDDVSLPLEKDIAISKPFWTNHAAFQPKDYHHVERMLYSCLVDADFLDTERFMQPDQAVLREGKSSLMDLLPKLDSYLSKFGEPKTFVNKIRNDIQKVCLKDSDKEPGFYSLTVPTGGGKTISSLVWAIHHAIKNNKKRIIIAIPYTSIIVQTASVLRGVFGEENVLEHHSNVSFDEKKDGELSMRLKLSTENWDYPIIVTTNVQLFESMFSSHSSHCRKLHNICNSVVILDEVQTLPTDFLQPIIDALDTYHRVFGCSILFTTASQPILTGLNQGTNRSIKFDGLQNVNEIIPKDFRLHEKLKRVKLSFNDSPKSYDEIAERLMQHDRVLCIVNTRRDAKEIFDRLSKDGTCIHLSRMMCPKHLSEKIQEMKSALENSENKIVRVVSTQLIEAGVDIDFPVVYRQEAGLDSVLQAAGRCNREGKLDVCTTYVFGLGKSNSIPPGHLSQSNNARKNMKLNSNYDWFSPEAMNEYFRQLYARISSFDKKKMKEYLYKPKEMMLETAAKEFKLIDDSTFPVIVNWKDGSCLVDILKQHGPYYSLIKLLSQYSVNLRLKDFEKLMGMGAIEEILDGIYYIADKNQYLNDVGLLTENLWIEETWIV